VFSSALWWVAAAVVALIAVQILIGRLRRWWASARARAKGRHASRAERRAARLLRRAGFQIEAVQPQARLHIVVDDRPRSVAVRADYLVSRGGFLFVAEVKSGRVAASLECATTRRQLLEYRLAYDVDGVLLVDMVAKRVHDVHFPGFDDANLLAKAA